MGTQDQNQNQSQGGSKRGFASKDEKEQKDIAKKGGESVPPEQRPFSKDPNLASEAGRKGGESSQGGGNKSSENEREGMNRSEAGRKGGEHSH